MFLLKKVIFLIKNFEYIKENKHIPAESSEIHFISKTLKILP